MLFFILLFFTFSCELELEKANPIDNLLINNIEIVDLGTSSATVSGFLNTNEFSGVEDYGHCWSIEEEPSIEDNCTSFGEITTSNYTFSSNIGNLNLDETYFVRSYAVANDMVFYGEKTISFTTFWSGDIPLVETNDVSSITSTSANLFGSIVDQGESEVFNFGHCYSLSENPTVNDFITNGEFSGKNGDFSSSLTNLSPNTTYYYRAFAENSQSNETPSYGFVYSFSTTSGEPSVLTVEAEDITAETAILKGQIIGTGDSSITERGHYWSTDQNNIEQNTSLSSDQLEFSSTISNLNPETTYYYCAYATNSFGTSLGEIMSFNTSDGKPNIITGNSNNVNASGANLEGTIIDEGDSNITQHGHCWSVNQNPTLTSNNGLTLLGDGLIGLFSSTIDDLNANTVYYYCAYATNSFGTSYGEVKILTTANGLPHVETGNYSNLTANSINLQGEIISIGDSNITQHGHCWSTNSNPNLFDQCSNNGAASVGMFSSSVNNLLPSTTYYYRSYATNSFGTSYGESIESFTTGTFPIAEFSTSDVDLLVGESAYFLDLSQNNPNSWSWNIDNATPSYSNSQNPTFSFNNIGRYDVELSVSNNYGSDTELKTNYITVIDCESFANGSGEWNNSGWSSSTNPSSCLNGEAGCFYSWGGNSSNMLTHTLSKSFQNVPSNTKVSFWYRVYAGGMNFSLKFNGITIWTAPTVGFGGWTQEIVTLPQGGNFTLTFESNIIGTSSMYIDQICIEP